MDVDDRILVDLSRPCGTFTYVRRGDMEFFIVWDHFVFMFRARDGSLEIENTWTPFGEKK